MNDKLKQQLMVALVAFNFSVLGYMFFKYFTIRMMDWQTVLIHLLIGAAIGLVAGAIGYFVAGMGK
jgi:RsiW-degrading membrane proteinase PrsW (M82 family)